MAFDSSFARLTTAWNADAGATAVALAKRGFDVLARKAGLRQSARDAVLWVGTAEAKMPPAAVTSLQAGRRNYRIKHVVPDSDLALDCLVQQLRPRLLVADVDWCAQVGISAVRRLHRHRPEVDWLLCWDEPSPRWLDTLIHSGARGAVLRRADDVSLARALDAVVGGELWLPRQVMQWLYVSLVDVAGDDHAAMPSSQSSVDSELTPREVEVAALMRHGLTNRDIAERLGVSVNTVKKHLASTYEKQGLRSRRQARA